MIVDAEGIVETSTQSRQCFDQRVGAVARIDEILAVLRREAERGPPPHCAVGQRAGDLTLIVDRKCFGIRLRQRVSDAQIEPFARFRNAVAIVVPQECTLAIRANEAADKTAR